MQDAPYLDMLGLLEIEEQVRIPGHGPRPETRNVELMGITRRTGARMATDVRKGRLQFVDKSRGCLRTSLRQIPIDCRFDVLDRKLAGTDWLGLQRAERPRVEALPFWTRARSCSK